MKLFLLDAYALIYRAYYGLIKNPRINSRGENVSAIFGFFNTLEEVLSKPILGKYTPLSFRDLLLLMAQYPDICVITDTKFMDAEPVTAQFTAMLDDARKLGMTYLFDLSRTADSDVVEKNGTGAASIVNAYTSGRYSVASSSKLLPVCTPMRLPFSWLSELN